MKLQKVYELQSTSLVNLWNIWTDLYSRCYC